uniref:Uncharacterized protein n=1 Tax=Arundo donax TaxID=35708 RepID=A0A0A8XVN0_ARUDO
MMILYRYGHKMITQKDNFFVVLHDCSNDFAGKILSRNACC